MTTTNASTYAASTQAAESEDTVTITMTADEATAVLEALNEPCLKTRPFFGLSDAPFRQYLVEVSDALAEAGVVLPSETSAR